MRARHPGWGLLAFLMAAFVAAAMFSVPGAEAKAPEWQWRTGANDGFVRKYSGCDWPTVEIRSKGPVVGGSTSKGPRAYSWERGLRKGKWVQRPSVKTKYADKTFCMNSLFPGAVYSYDFAKNGTRITFDGKHKHVWKGKRVIKYSSQPPEVARSRNGRAGALAWFEKVKGGRMLRVALIGHNIKGSGKKGILVVKKKIPAAVIPDFYGRGSIPVVIDSRGNLGIAWNKWFGSQPYRIYSLWRSANGEWSDIEEVAGTVIDAPSISMAFDGKPGNKGFPRTAIAWTSCGPGYYDFRLSARIRDGGGTWMPVRDTLVDGGDWEECGSDSTISIGVDLLGGVWLRRGSTTTGNPTHFDT